MTKKTSFARSAWRLKSATVARITKSNRALSKFTDLKIAAPTITDTLSRFARGITAAFITSVTLLSTQGAVAQNVPDVRDPRDLAKTPEEIAMVERWRGKIPASPWNLRTQNGARSKVCTATFVKIDGSCVLLTNDHCLLSDEALLSVPGVNGESRARVIKRDKILDLAQIEIPSAIGDMTCNFLRDNNSAQLILGRASLMSQGNQKGQNAANFSGDKEWRAGMMDESEISIYRVTNDPNDFYLRATNIDVNPGMSGGFVMDSRTNFVGLHAHYIPFAGIALLIPPKAIAAFLKGNFVVRTHPSSAEPTNSYRPTGGNSHGDPGGNSHGDPGGNSHGDPGGNSHGDPNGGGYFVHPFDLAQEPLEGFAIESDPRMTVLAVGPYTIDGRDDYFKYFFKRDPRLKVVTRPSGADQYPDLAIRRGLLKRLEGTYLNQTKASAQTDYIYVRDPSQVVGWRRVGTGHPMMALKIDAAKNEVLLTATPSSLRLVNGTELKTPPVKLVLRWVEDRESKVIHLIGANVLNEGEQRQTIDLVCRNQNYSKLICENEIYFFSIAITNHETGELNYRFGVGTTAQGTDIFTFRFGEMKRIAR